MKNFLQTFILCFLCIIGIFSCQEDGDNSRAGELFTKKAKSKEKSTASTTAVEKKQWGNLLNNPYAAIDEHARNSPKSAEVDIVSLTKYLGQKARTDLEKSRSIYVWIAENIKYDDKAFNSGKYGDYSVEGVLDHRKAVCEGYSNLFLAMGQEMGLEIEKVVGYSKGYGYVAGSKFDKSDHAWNAIKINGEWRIFDATWGRGNGTNVRGKLVSKKEFNDYWFNVDPYEAIFSHMPEDNEFSFVKPALTLKEYEQMPHVNSDYFKFGFGGKALYTQVYNQPKIEFPTSYSVNTLVKVVTAPPFKVLKMNESYDFEFMVPAGQSVAVIDAKDNWTHFKKEKDLFKLNYTPQEKGDLKISIQLDKSKKTYHGILMYAVEKDKDAI